MHAYRGRVLERVALQQNRFRTPGVAADPRGVAFADNGLLLFASLERAVSFLRAYSHASSLDELIPSLRILQLLTKLKTRELAIMFRADSTARMDRIASVARLAQGLVFVGGQNHFVKYRDANSPLGYDMSDAVTLSGDVVLHHDAFEQSYSIERTLLLKDILLRLSPEPHPTPTKDEHSLLFVAAEAGLGPSVLRHLARANATGTVSYVEWPSQSSFDDTPRRVFLFSLTRPHARFVALFKSLPGVRVFVPAARNLAVEIDRKHPVALASCKTAFNANDLVLFRHDGVDTVTSFDAGVPLDTLVRADVTEEDAHAHVPASTQSALAEFNVPIRIRPSTDPLTTPTAVMVPRDQRSWLVKLLYLTPPDLMRTLRLAVTNTHLCVICERGVEGLPIGTHYREVAPRVFVPSGWTIEPPLEQSVLLSLLALPEGTNGFFDLATSKLLMISDSAFSTATHHSISTIQQTLLETESVPEDAPRNGALVYGDRTSLPLWGAVGKDLPKGDAT